MTMDATQLEDNADVPFSTERSSARKRILTFWNAGTAAEITTEEPDDEYHACVSVSQLKTQETSIAMIDAGNSITVIPSSACDNDYSIAEPDHTCADADNVMTNDKSTLTE